MCYEYVYYNALINNIDSKSDDTFTHEPNLVFKVVPPLIRAIIVLDI